jgi:hypothetical protein
MNDLSLRADCARCAALCCVALAFDKSRLFGFDKAGGEPCRNLGARGDCRIHASRLERGFGGCVGYDCLGAGQRVTQDLFGGRTWRKDPALLGPMSRAFLVYERAHRLLALLAEARKLPLSRADQACRNRLEAAIAGSDIDFDRLASLETQAHGFLRGLRGCLRERAG